VHNIFSLLTFVGVTNDDDSITKKIEDASFRGEGKHESLNSIYFCQPFIKIESNRVSDGILFRIQRSYLVWLSHPQSSVLSMTIHRIIVSFILHTQGKKGNDLNAKNLVNSIFFLCFFCM